MVRKSCMRGALVAVLMIAISGGSLGALDVSLHMTPEYVLPVSDSTDLFSAVFSGTMTANLDLLGFMAPFAEGGVTYAGLNGVTSNSLVLLNGGAGLQLYVYPIPRIKLAVKGSGGLYYGFTTDSSALARTDLYWKGAAELGFRMSPTSSILLTASYQDYLQNDLDPLLSGLGFGVVFDTNLGKHSSAMKYAESPRDSIYPVQFSSYAKASIGTVEITNTEAAELTDVKVYFTIGDYSSEPALCAKVARVARGATIKVPLYASLNPNTLAVTETTKIQGSLKVEYDLLGALQTIQRNETVTILHRNALTWKDPTLVAGFVNSTDPAVLDLTKFVAGLVRQRIRPDLDKKLQFGMGLFESLRLLGLKYSADPSTPYVVFHKDTSKVDYLQYPYQTLSYKGGDSDDLAVLYAAMLESVDVPSAMVFLDDDVIVALKLEMADSQAKSFFLNPGELIYKDGAAWVPVQMSKLREGFISAWLSASAALRKASETKPYTFIETAKAWSTHEPVGIPGIDFRSPKPEESQLALAFENVMGRFVSKEAEPRAERLVADMGGNGTGKQYNSLGVLYARYGLLPKAREAFAKASQLNYLPAFTNVANVAFLQKDYESAITYYEAALKINPDNVTAVAGLARAKYEVDAYADADALYAKVMKLDPSLASRFAYLSSVVDATTSRASSAAADRGGATAWDVEP